MYIQDHNHLKISYITHRKDCLHIKFHLKEWEYYHLLKKNHFILHKINPYNNWVEFKELLVLLKEILMVHKHQLWVVMVFQELMLIKLNILSSLIEGVDQIKF